MFLRSNTSTLHLMMRLMLAFIDRSGRMSCFQAATAVAVCPAHKAQICRFVARRRWRSRRLDDAYRDVLLKREAASQGRFLLILDATAYDAKVFQEACARRQYFAVCPAIGSGRK